MARQRTENHLTRIRGSATNRVLQRATAFCERERLIGLCMCHGARSSHQRALIQSVLILRREYGVEAVARHFYVKRCRRCDGYFIKTPARRGARRRLDIPPPPPSL